MRGVSLQPVPARSPQIIEFMFGTHYQVRKRGCEAPENVRAVALVGARTSPSAELILSGNVDAFTIVFLPGAFSMLCGVPAGELTNGDFNGQEVLGQRINEQAEHSAMQMPNSSLGGHYAGRIQVNAIEQTSRVEDVAGQLKSWREELLQQRKQNVSQSV